MKTERKGRTAPWAKALGAVLLVPVVVVVALFAVARHREGDRERDAFDATVTDARRFADALAGRGAAPSPQDVRDVLAETAGRGDGVLHEVRPAADGTRVIVQFSHTYERSPALFGPSTTTADRCFTIDLPVLPADESSEGTEARVTAHGPDESCLDVAAAAPGRGETPR
ncbi:hypothetical protein [Streptomyces exfoliatus]|uniref:hypothetical protein n=1 Tax=Streptomyces exfoliatus TaxID=1905 RepID=UPI003C2FD18E